MKRRRRRKRHRRKSRGINTEAEVMMTIDNEHDDDK